MSKILNHPDFMPNIFPGLKIIGPAVDDIALFKQHAVNFDAKGVSGEVRPTSSPVIQTTSANRQAYQSCNFPLIKQLEDLASEDLNDVFNNINQHGFAAFQKCEFNGKPLYASWSRGGMVWGYTESVNPVNNDPSIKYEAVVQFGTYAETAQIAGISAYNLRLPELLIEGILAGLMVKLLASYVAEGLTFIAAAFAAKMGLILAEWGIALTFTLPEFVIPLVAACIVFTIVFVGLSYIFNFLNRQYHLRLQIMNWDPTQEWEVDGQYLSNAEIPGHEDGILKFNLPKMLPPGSTVTPPGWTGPIHILDSVCYYGTAIWNNRSTFMQGCSMAVRVRRNNTDDGFMWAFDLPRWSANRQVILPGTQDPYAFYEDVFRNDKWDQNPLQCIKICSNTLNPIRYGLDFLTGGPDNLFNVVINIGGPFKPNL